MTLIFLFLVADTVLMTITAMQCIYKCLHPPWEASEKPIRTGLHRYYIYTNIPMHSFIVVILYISILLISLHHHFPQLMVQGLAGVTFSAFQESPEWSKDCLFSECVYFRAPRACLKMNQKLCIHTTRFGVIYTIYYIKYPLQVKLPNQAVFSFKHIAHRVGKQMKQGDATVCHMILW